MNPLLDSPRPIPIVQEPHPRHSSEPEWNGRDTHAEQARGLRAENLNRVMNVVLAGIGLLLASPIMLLFAVLVRVTSRGPIFYTQARVGLDRRRARHGSSMYDKRTRDLGGRPFMILKFRTMRTGAETTGAVWAVKKDTRVTPIGRVMRKYRVDELPQLVNVITGHMSLVGPRPLPVRDVQGFSEDWQRRRFSVLPGITCLWQMSGRSNISFQRWMEMDLEYIDRWSLWLDLSILARTMPAVLKRQGAY